MTATEAAFGYLFDTYIATIQRGVTRGVHRHAAYQLTVALDGRPYGVGAASGELRRARAHLVGSNTPHAFDGGEGEQVLFWLSPESTLARRLAHTYLQDREVVPLPEEVLADLPLAELREAPHERFSAARMRHLTEELLVRLARSTRRPPEALHPAVRKAVHVIRGLETKKISADELARRVGLSKSRLLHVFKDHMGIPLRPYLQWLRCLDALIYLAEGRTISEAAVWAGFTDGAHCNRVMRRFFCVSPSALMARATLHFELCLSEMIA